MSTETEQRIDINSWLAEELYREYMHNHATVDESWREVFEETKSGAANGAKAPNGTPAPSAPAIAAPAAPPAPAAKPVPAPPDSTERCRATRATQGSTLRLAENMMASLAVPTATSLRTIPVKVIDENRRLLNQWRDLHGKGKISYTHLISWAIVRAVKAMPAVNHAFTEVEGAAHRLVRNEINIGIAVDIAGKDGNRALVVPNVKNAGSMIFGEFLRAFDDVVAARGRQVNA